MRHFGAAVSTYILMCLLGVGVIVLRGDGPHPTIAAVFPPNGDQFFPGGVAEITFSQPMDHASVERALDVSPGLQGQGAWYANTLNLQPVDDWRPNVTYHVTLSGLVTDDQGRPLKTPYDFWFRVHHVGRLQLCDAASRRTICERSGPHIRPLFVPPRSIQSFALSPDGGKLAYIRPDGSNLPHLFVANTDGTDTLQLTFGKRYADSHPSWPLKDGSIIDYQRSPVAVRRGRRTEGKPRLWDVFADGGENAPV